MLPRDIYRPPNAADPVLEERTVLAIVRRHGVRCAAVTSIDETGGEARVYVLDDNLVHGYCDETPATDEFIAAWRAALVLSDMSALATRPETRPQALERLRDLLITFA